MKIIAKNNVPYYKQKIIMKNKMNIEIIKTIATLITTAFALVAGLTWKNNKGSYCRIFKIRY